MKKYVVHMSIPVTLALLLGVTPVAPAATIISGELFFTTFQNQGGKIPPPPLTTNLWKVSFVYDSVAGLCLGSATLPCPAAPPPTTAIATLTGADGLIFDPADGTKLVIGEQSANLVARIGVNGAGLVEVKADGLGVDVEAYSMVVHPSKTQVMALVNSGTTSINVIPLSPLANGSRHAVTSGVDMSIKGMAFIGNTAYYGDDDDAAIAGHFGTIDLSNINTPGGIFMTTRSTIIDDVPPAKGQGALPSHGLTYDSFSGCIIISSGTEIWQLCPDALLANTFHIKAKVSIPGPCLHPSGNPNCGQVNWDQTLVDGLGHLFSANNDGDVYFIDYSQSATKSISDAANYHSQQFLQVALDDIVKAQTQSADGRMTGGGSVFTAGGARVTHGFELHCDVHDVPNRLEINWPGNMFHLDTLISAFCFTDPSINSGHPTAPFNTYVGHGTGKLNGVPGATADWTFTDAGEPGVNDMATIVIKDASNAIVLTVSGKLDNGNQQAHPDNK